MYIRVDLQGDTEKVIAINKCVYAIRIYVIDEDGAGGTGLYIDIDGWQISGVDRVMGEKTYDKDIKLIFREPIDINNIKIKSFNKNYSVHIWTAELPIKEWSTMEQVGW